VTKELYIIPLGHVRRLNVAARTLSTSENQGLISDSGDFLFTTISKTG